MVPKPPEVGKSASGSEAVPAGNSGGQAEGELIPIARRLLEISAGVSQLTARIDEVDRITGDQMAAEGRSVAWARALLREYCQFEKAAGDESGRMVDCLGRDITGLVTADSHQLLDRYRRLFERYAAALRDRLPPNSVETLTALDN